jgi:hypothetical protein
MSRRGTGGAGARSPRGRFLLSGRATTSGAVEGQIQRSRAVANGRSTLPEFAIEFFSSTSLAELTTGRNAGERLWRVSRCLCRDLPDTSRWVRGPLEALVARRHGYGFLLRRVVREGRLSPARTPSSPSSSTVMRVTSGDDTVGDAPRRYRDAQCPTSNRLAQRPAPRRS